MSKEEIFKKYKANLNLLAENGLVSMAHRDVYVCPICLQPYLDFNGENQNPLTEEHTPPESLGGKVTTLTCKSCNNTAGTQFESHLIKRLREIDSSQFIPGTESSFKVEINGTSLNGKMVVDSDGTIKVEHGYKHNNPVPLNKAMETIKPGMIISPSFRNEKISIDNVMYGLLKIAYVMAFERLGYSIIFDKCFDIVREQILNPGKKIYPDNFQLDSSFPTSMTGIYFVCNNSFECMLVLFPLNTGKSERMFGVLLPLPVGNINTSIRKLNIQLRGKKGFKLRLQPFGNSNVDCISDINNIKAIYLWLEEKRPKKKLSKKNRQESSSFSEF